MITRIIQIASHRNGVAGEPFHAVLFNAAGNGNRLMLATVFEMPGVVSVLDADSLNDAAVGVAFGDNSWRADQYEAELRAAIRVHDEESDRVPSSRAEAETAPLALPGAERRRWKGRR